MCDFSPCAEACRLQNLLFVCSRRDEHSSGQIPGPRADGRRIVPLKRRSVTDCGRIVGCSEVILGPNFPVVTWTYSGLLGHVPFTGPRRTGSPA